MSLNNVIFPIVIINLSYVVLLYNNTFFKHVKILIISKTGPFQIHIKVQRVESKYRTRKVFDKFLSIYLPQIIYQCRGVPGENIYFKEDRPRGMKDVKTAIHLRYINSIIINNRRLKF